MGGRWYWHWISLRNKLCMIFTNIHLIWFDFTWFLHYYHQLWLNMCKYVCKGKRSVEFKIATYLHTHFEKIKKTSFEGRQTHTHSNTLIFMIHEFAIHTPKPLTVFHPHIWVDLSEQGRLVVVSGQWSCSKIISMWCQRKSLYANTFLLLGKLNKLNGNRMDFMSSIRWVKATISCCLLTQGKQFFSTIRDWMSHFDDTDDDWWLGNHSSIKVNSIICCCRVQHIQCTHKCVIRVIGDL